MSMLLAGHAGPCRRAKEAETELEREVGGGREMKNN